MGGNGLDRAESGCDAPRVNGIWADKRKSPRLFSARYHRLIDEHYVLTSRRNPVDCSVEMRLRRVHGMSIFLVNMGSLKTRVSHEGENVQRPRLVTNSIISASASPAVSSIHLQWRASPPRRCGKPSSSTSETVTSPGLLHCGTTCMSAR